MADRPYLPQLRIFVSSTFSDMVAERTVLLEKVFPVVAAHCHQKKAEWIGVDLRWGVTEEQSQRGETVDICMNEIDRCHPLFLGMVGERYGWVPPGNNISVTEQEILYGALTAPADTEAFFYLRDSALTEVLCGPFEKDDRLEKLKDRIRASRYPVMDGYRDLDSFAAQVTADLIAAADRLIARDAARSPVEEARNNQLFLARRYTNGYVERPKIQRELMEAVCLGGLTLLTGEAGVGKTAMLADSGLKSAEKPDVFTFLYFSGSAADKGWEQLARQLLSEIREALVPDLPEPEDREGLRRAVYQGLSMAAQKKRIALFLDQLDALALDDTFGLSFLPAKLPEGVSAIVSLNEGDALDRMRRREHREIRIERLTPDMSVQAAVCYLSDHSKNLSPEQLAIIRSSKQAQNPLFLMTVLNEIRTVGDYFHLSEQMRDYFSCGGIAELLELVLDRLDRDYNEDGDRLPRRLLLLLECGRGGLTEAELLGLLGGLPYAKFMPLRLALEPFTAVSGGAIHVASPAFREALYRHYAPAEEELAAIRAGITAWFDAHPDTPRCNYVLPWILKETGQYEELGRLLAQPKRFAEIWQRNCYEAREYWSVVSAHGSGAAERYKPVIETPENYGTDALRALASFFADIGEVGPARTLLNRLSGSEDVDIQQRCEAFGLLGNLNRQEGKVREAETCYRRKAELAATTGNHYEEERALGNIGLLALMRGEIREAQCAFEEMLALAESLNQQDARQVALGNLGNVAFAMGDPKRAAELYSQQKAVSLDSGNLAGVINACGALGILYSRAKAYDAAEREFVMQETESRRIGAADGLANALGNQAALADLRGDRDRVEALLQEKLDICRRSGLAMGQQNALGNLAALVAEQGRTNEALVFARERAELTRRCRMFRQYAESLQQLADLEERVNLTDEAKQHRLLAETLGRQHGFDREERKT